MKLHLQMSPLTKVSRPIGITNSAWHNNARFTNIQMLYTHVLLNGIADNDKMVIGSPFIITDLSEHNLP